MGRAVNDSRINQANLGKPGAVADPVPAPPMGRHRRPDQGAFAYWPLVSTLGAERPDRGLPGALHRGRRLRDWAAGRADARRKTARLLAWSVRRHLVVA